MINILNGRPTDTRIIDSLFPCQILHRLPVFTGDGGLHSVAMKLIAVKMQLIAAAMLLIGAASG